jgi:alginate O-acetyltransferase complex protein AlgI
MIFSSITFLLYFLPIFLLFYFISSKKHKNTVLLLFSLLFYSWGAPQFIGILLASTIIDFYLVRQLHHSEVPRQRKLLLGLSIALNLGLLAYFKYANFFLENTNVILNNLGQPLLSWEAILLPIGISFYTFQTLTYSIDVYRKVHPPLQRVQDYVLYIIMFPQLIAGPIVRFNTIANELVDRTSTYDDRLLGFFRFCIGLAKKVLIANVLGAAVTDVLGNDPTLIAWHTIDTPIAWYCLLAYTFQLYFDFSGYSDMAIGLGRMLGFSFPENFDNPYVSRSITEFWRRWHITLGAFMREYLYIPLGGSRVSTGRMYFNLWLVFLLSGLWHSASWNFVLWGAYHGFFLVVERVFLLKTFEKLGQLGNVLSLIYCFFVVIMGWVLFFIEDLNAVRLFYAKLFAFDYSLTLPYTTQFYLILVVAFVFAFWTLVPPLKRLHDWLFFGTYSIPQISVFYLVALVLLVCSIASIAAGDFNPFIYYRF